MTEPETPPQERVVTVLDREITVKEPTPLQASILGRSFQRAIKVVGDAKPGDDLSPEQLRISLEAIGMFLDIMENLVALQADRDWLEQRIMDGTIKGFNELSPILSAFSIDQAAPNRAARRARK